MESLKQRKEELITDLAGIIIMFIGLVSLTESLLQKQLIGAKLPLVQGTFISLTAVMLGSIMMTENATKAFKYLRDEAGKKLK
jgi:hypothetical protein